MSAVKELGKQKLEMYFDKIKYLAESEAEHFNFKSKNKLIANDLILTTENIYFTSDNKIINQHLDNKIENKKKFKINLDLLKKNINGKLISISNKYFYLKIPNTQGYVLWIFNHQGINNLLNDKNILGESGEIYLVTPKNKIASASRFINHWDQIKIKNKSTENGKKKLSGTHITNDYRNVKVVSSYLNFQYDQLQFILISEMDWSEVTRTINKVYIQIALIGLIMSVIAFFIALTFSRNVLDTIENMYNKLNSLSLKILTTQENERKRISTNIHDGLGQILTVIKWKIDGFSFEPKSQSISEQNLNEIKTLINKSIKEIRNIAHDIKPLEIEINGTFNAIKENMQNISEISVIKFDFKIDDALKNKKFIEGQDINLYRLSQEFIQNAIKHSKATQVSISFREEKKCLIIEYQDNGIGMANPNRLPENITYRSNLMSANLELINNGPGNLFFKIIVKFSKIFYE